VLTTGFYSVAPVTSKAVPSVYFGFFCLQVSSVSIICDGDDGLKVYSVADPYAIDQNLLSHQADINTFDVIPFNDVLMMIGDDGLYQYDYSDISNLVLLSVIPVN